MLTTAILIEPHERYLALWRQNSPLELPDPPLVEPEALAAYPDNDDLINNHLDRETVKLFRQYRLPYLYESQIAHLRSVLRPHLAKEPLKQTIDPQLHIIKSFRLEPVWMMAANLGMHDEILAEVKKWPDRIGTGSHHGDPNYDIPKLLYGLNNVDDISQQLSRLSIALHDREDLIGWIAHSGDNRLDVFLDSLEGLSNCSNGWCNPPGYWNEATLMSVLQLVESPKTVEPMFHFYLHSKCKSEAKAWLLNFPEWSLMPLLEVAEKGLKYSTSAKMLVKEIVTSIDHERFDETLKHRLRKLAVLSGSSSETAESGATIDGEESSIVDAVKSVTGGKKAAKLPGWLSEDVVCDMADKLGVPPIVAVQIIAALQQSTPEKHQPLIPVLRQLRQQNQIQSSFDAFCWELFETWLGGDAPPKDKWALFSIGYLGSESLNIALLPYMYNWRESGNHQRAFYGLESLRICGTDGALMRIHQISQSSQLRSLRGKAIQYLQKIAEDRGMTPAQLEDRIVPTCGLDDDGTKIFDFGPRKFRFVLGSDLKPMIKDEDGKVKSDLPAVTQKDDPELAAAAAAQWKVLKKDMRTIAKMQAVRLELAMSTGRRWTLDEFKTLILGHPLMIILARTLLWATYDASGAMISTFRITDENTFADAQDKSTSIDGDGATCVGIVHAYHLGAELKNSWGEIFSDYSIVAPFPQLGRALNKLEESEHDSKFITRFANSLVPAFAIGSHFDKMGWWRGSNEQGGMVYHHAKLFYGQNITAVAEYEGYYLGMPGMSPDQGIKRCYFLSGIVKETDYIDANYALRLGDVDPVAVSEILQDLILLAAKTK